jgi:hypothetical protein
MKVRELIDALSKLDREQLILVDGYEMGYDPIAEIKNIRVQYYADHISCGSYSGDYEEYPNFDKLDTPVVKAYILSR